MAKSQEITRIKVYGFYSAVVDFAAKKIISSIEEIEAKKPHGTKVKGPVPLPTNKEIVTIIRATHKYKDSREQFERRTHKRIIDVIDASPEVMDALIRINLPKSVQVQIKKV